MSYMQIFKLPNMSFNAIGENKILAKISEFTALHFSPIFILLTNSIQVENIYFNQNEKQCQASWTGSSLCVWVCIFLKKR